MKTMFQDLVRSRYSARRFLDTPLSSESLQNVLEDAQCAPSNCNTQPWQVHIVSGAKKDGLSAKLLEADQAGNLAPDFSFAIDAYQGPFVERAKEQGAEYYKYLGIAREDAGNRSAASLQNLHFFGAPHVAFLFMPSVGDNVRVASDMGMYAQNLLLALTAHGFAGIPQTMLGFHAETVRTELGVDPSLKLLFGISFGYADPAAPGNQLRTGRVAIADSVTFHQ